MSPAAGTTVSIDWLKSLRFQEVSAEALGSSDELRATEGRILTWGRQAVSEGGGPGGLINKVDNAFP